MRKKIAALLAMLMLGGVLTGCGGGNKVATGGEDPNVVPVSYTHLLPISS